MGLAIAQVQEHLHCEAVIRAHSDRPTRDAARAAESNARAWLHTARDQLSRGLGWPHAGEEILIQATYRAAAAKDGPAAEISYDGPGRYNGSFSITTTVHSVLIADRLDAVHVAWTPLLGDHGPADPAGTIPMRLLAAPQRPLIAPLLRWPTTARIPAWALSHIGGHNMATAANNVDDDVDGSDPADPAVAQTLTAAAA